MSMETGNGTAVQAFTLEGFPAVQHLGKVLFLVHLPAYLASIAGSTLIGTVTCADSRLRTPMYFFLSTFSFIECCFTILGHLQASALPNHHEPEDLLPLVTTCFALGFSLITGPVVKLSRLSFCGLHVIPHFFCDLSLMVHLSCPDTKSIEMLHFVLALCVLLTSLLITIISYSNIVITVMQLPSANERQKAFSTCSSYLIVLSLMYSSCVFIYMKPKETNRLGSNSKAALVNTVVTPLLNPVTYTL
ncbi:olfactory receptor 6S1-like protein [Camelus ferus]|nr:olfactory receptor 6S1-like protein [Camelus ferus]